MRVPTQPPQAVAAARQCAHLGAVLTAFPFFWMLTTSFKPLSEARGFPPAVLPMAPTLDHTRGSSRISIFGRYLVNTLVVVLISFVGLLIMAMAGYGFAKYGFRGRRWMFSLVLATMMIPVQVTMIPTFLILNERGLTNTLVGIALPALVSAFSIFLFRQFMGTIPDELLEAARLDGAGEMRIFPPRAAHVPADLRRAGGAHLHRRLEQLPLATDHRQRPGLLHPLGRPLAAQPAAQRQSVAADGGGRADGRSHPHRLRHLPRHVVRGFTMSGLK